MLILTKGVLRELYKVVIMSMEQNDKIKDYEHVGTSLINEESKMDPDDGENALYTRGRGRGRSPARGRSPGRGQRGQSSQGRPSTLTQNQRIEGICYNCRIQEHRVMDYYKRSQYGQYRGNSQNRGYNNRESSSYRGNYTDHSYMSIVIQIIQE